MVLGTGQLIRRGHRPNVALGTRPSLETRNHASNNVQLGKSLPLKSKNPYAVIYTSVGDCRRGSTERRKRTPISYPNDMKEPSISEDKGKEERCNVAPFWYDRSAKIERQKLDFRLITQKQRAELSQEVLSELQRRLKSMHDNTTRGSGDFSDMPLGDYGALAVISTLESNTSATSLDLHNTQMGSDAVRRLAIALEKNDRINSIRLGGAIHQGSHEHNRIGDSGVLALATTIRAHPSLSNLEIESDSMSNNGIDAIAESLDFEDEVETDEGKKTIRNIGVISRLALNSRRVSNIRRFAKSILATPCHIVSLDLSKCAIRNKGAMELAYVLKKNMTITSLSLRFSSIEEKGLVGICNAVRKYSVVVSHLDLAGNSFSDEVGIAVGRMLQFTRAPLMHVGVRGGGWLKGIGESGGNAIAEALESGRIKHLRVLDMRGHTLPPRVELRLWHSGRRNKKSKIKRKSLVLSPKSKKFHWGSTSEDIVVLTGEH